MTIEIVNDIISVEVTTAGPPGPPGAPGSGGSGGGISQADADIRYVNASGDSMTGALTVAGNITGQSGTFTGGASMNGSRVTNVATPTNNTDGANKQYVDTTKLPVTYIAPNKTTTAITLQGAASVSSTDADQVSVFDGKAGSTGTKTFWLNERGNPRTKSADDNEPTMRIIQASATQAANLLEINDYTNAVQLAKFGPTGLLTLAQGLRVTSGTLGSGRVLTSDASGNATWQLPSGGGSGFTRTSTSLTTSGLAAGASQKTTIALANGYRLYRITCSAASRVRMYSTIAKRDADETRIAGTYPSGDHGLVLEFIAATGLFAMDLTPAVEGMDMAATPTGAIPITITNNGTSTAAITVGLDWVRSE